MGNNEQEMMMTDKVCALTVALKRNVREEDVKQLSDAILQMRNVIGVSNVPADELKEAVSRVRVLNELRQEIDAILYRKLTFAHHVEPDPMVRGE